MPERIVKLKLSLIDCLDNDEISNIEMYGKISENPRKIEYLEEDKITQVTMTFRDETIYLKRKYEGTTVMDFSLNKRGKFEIKDDQSVFNGEVETLNMIHNNDLIYIHYRLYVNDDLITEQKLELTIKEAEA
ncbi:MAG TPA: DUF1934 family protein [Erysipelotrichaceae bacterium]|nr:DUF1934 family protein [Erysipelotrichaceae bacterium]